MQIPNWFLYLMSTVATLMTAGGIPWATWVTYTLIVIQQDTKVVDANTQRITSLEVANQNSQTQFQVIAATRFTSEQGRVLQTGIDRLEMKVDTITKDLGDLKYGRNGTQSKGNAGTTSRADAT